MMHFTDFFSIVERDIEILNPTSREKLMLLADYCGIRDGSRVLDVGSGKGYMLREWAKRWDLEGTGLEINADFISAARERSEAENVSDRLTFIEGDARDFGLDPRLREGYDVVTCIGAPFAVGTYEEAASWMLRALKPGGVLAIGDVYLRDRPPEEYAGREEYPALIERHDFLEGLGLHVTGVICASGDDWDRYACAGWRAARDWVRENPDHEDRSEVLAVVDESRREHLRFQRRYLGWAVLVATSE